MLVRSGKTFSLTFSAALPVPPKKCKSTKTINKTSTKSQRVNVRRAANKQTGQKK